MDRRIPFLDVLRSIAISLVVLCHFRELPGCPDWYRSLFVFGMSGVDLFFVLSGYLIGGQVFREVERSGRIAVRRFWVRRWFRTVPAYLLMLGAMTGIGMIEFARLPTYLVFLQNYRFPVEWLHSWSLCVEEHFYLFLPLIVNLAVRLPPPMVKLVAAGALMMSPLLRALRFGYVATLAEPMGNPVIEHDLYLTYLLTYYCLSHQRLEGLALGLLLAFHETQSTTGWQRLARHGRWCGLAGATILVLGLWGRLGAGPIADGKVQMEFFTVVLQPALVSIGTALLIVFGITTARRQVPGAFHFAEYSYSLYLTHVLAMKFILAVETKHPLPFWGAFVASWALALALSFAVRGLAELPGLALRNRLLAR